MTSSYMDERDTAELEATLMAEREKYRQLAEWKDRLDASIHRQNETIARLQKESTAFSHVIIESGITPGKYCKCDYCRFTARGMDEAGFMDGVEDRWWAKEQERWDDE